MKKLNQKIAITFIAILSLSFGMNAQSVKNEKLPIEGKITAEQKKDLDIVHTTKNVGPQFSSKLIDIYPIPSSGTINVRLSSTGGPINFSIYDVLGNLVYQETIMTEAMEVKKEFDLSELRPGLYLFRAGEDVRKIKIT